jgi:hypothetical protein
MRDGKRGTEMQRFSAESFVSSLMPSTVSSGQRYCQRAQLWFLCVIRSPQQMAAHESARTTGLYDRRNDEISLDEVERIGI